MALHRREPEDQEVRPQPQLEDAAALRELRRQAREAPALAPAELADLLERSALGDRSSENRVVAAGMPMVVRLADTRRDQGLPLLDLVQEGSIGLVQAVRTFARRDPSGFEAFAEQEVGRQMDAAIAAEAAAVRDAQLLVEAATDFERTELLMRRELQRSPTDREIAEKLEWTVERTRYVAQVVADARRRHDEELLAFIDPDVLDLDDGERADLDG